MDKNKTATKTISNIVRKLLKSKDISIKKAANYIDCTEQSFRNKLSRDSFSIRDLIILCYVCDAELSIDYTAYTDDYDVDYFQLSDYLTQEDYERVKTLEKQYLTEDLANFVLAFAKSVPEKDFKKMSNEELGELVKKQFRGKIQLIDETDDITDND